MKTIFSLLSILFFATISLAQETKTDIYANNIVVVFDASGSMEDAIGNGDRNLKIDAAKAAMKQVIASLDDNTNIGIFVFGNVSNNNPVPIGPKNVRMLNQAIDRINEGGNTPLGEYLKKAADQLLEKRKKNLGYGKYKVLVVTDGEASDNELMSSVAPEIVRRGLSLDVIGVGMSKTHRLAQMSTSYRAANDTKALNKALLEVVAETSANNTTNESANDFQIISPLSNEESMAILNCLGTTENQPIGEKPAPGVIGSTIVTSTQAKAFVPGWIVVTFIIVVVLVIICMSLFSRY